MRFCLPGVFAADSKVSFMVRIERWGELHAGAQHCLLCHHLGLCLINNVCIQGMNRRRQGGRDTELIACVLRE